MKKQYDFSKGIKILAFITMLKQKISLIDKKIDDIVYRLYGLTDEEIRIVEGN